MGGGPTTIQEEVQYTKGTLNTHLQQPWLILSLKGESMQSAGVFQFLYDEEKKDYCNITKV